MSDIYDPYTYNPTARSFFVTGASRTTSLPDSAAILAVNEPALKQHINSVWDFASWMKTAFPDMYHIIVNAKPELLDPVRVVATGALSPDNKGKSGMAGLSDASDYDEYGDYTPASGTNNSAMSPATDWGNTILSTIKSTVPAFLQIKSQNDLMSINIKRAEQGLKPIDSSSLAPTMNVGVSPGVTQMGYIAIGGLMLFGLVSMLKKRK